MTNGSDTRPSTQVAGGDAGRSLNPVTRNKIPPIGGTPTSAATKSATIGGGDLPHHTDGDTTYVNLSNTQLLDPALSSGKAIVISSLSGRMEGGWGWKERWVWKGEA